MRSLRTSMAVAWLLGIAPALVTAQNLPSAKNLLELRPILKGVEYETPADQAAIDACKVETVVNAQKRPIGYALRDGQGKLLRKFVDNNGDRSMDQWSYYQDGFEVYRESDLNGDKSPDECRWMNLGGTRIAQIAGGKIVGWKRISAEEASKVLVQALVGADLPLLESVIATPQELEALGLPKAVIEKASAAAPERAKQVNTLLKSLTGWNNKTTWSRLDGMMPHLIPADPGNGLAQDVTLYENAVIFAAPPNGGNSSKMAFLQAPDMVKIGDTWKFIELPRSVEPGKTIVSSDGGVRAALAQVTTGAVGPPDQPPAVKEAIEKVVKYTTENAKLLNSGDKKDIARYHVGLIPLLHNVVKVAPDAETKLNNNKQIVESLAAAYQTGFYPKGLELLNGLIEEGGELASFAAFRKISAEFAAKNEAGENPLASQKKWMTDLKEFADKYPKAAEVPDALFQFAQGHEFNAEEDEARKYYTQIVQEFSTSESGKKATGALKRLDLVGKSIALKGPGLKNEEIDAAQYRGKVLLVFFWATWAEPVKRDLPELNKLAQKYRANGFEILGVNLDNERADLDAFLKANTVPGSQIFEPGGMESRLATEYGIISLPTMILVDPQGKVINRNIRTASELERQLEKVLAAKGGGVAFGAK